MTTLTDAEIARLLALLDNVALGPRPHDDAAFIAAARDAVPKLVAEVRRLRSVRTGEGVP